MRDEDYSPFAKPAPKPPRETIVVFLVTRETAKGFETLTGALRDIDGQRWEALYLRNSELYLTQTCGTRELAARHLTQQRAALEAAGWTPQAVSTAQSRRGAAQD